MTAMKALIEATEEAKQILNDAGNSSFTESIIDAMNILGAAIASAKAAEEGVETAWVVECKRRGLTETWLRDDLESGQASYSAAVRDYPNADCIRLLRKDDYSTVIEVREKEGLDQ